MRKFLDDWRYAYKEFSVPGDRGNVGGILGIDPRSWDRGLLVGDLQGQGGRVADDGLQRQGLKAGLENGKVRVLRAVDIPVGPAASSGNSSN